MVQPLNSTNLNSVSNISNHFKKNRSSPVVKKTQEQVGRIRAPKNPLFVNAKKLRVINAKGVQANTKKEVIERDDLQGVRKELAKKLNDIERVDEILHDYATILEKKIPDPVNKKLFENWMTGIAYFLGSPHYDHNLFFKHQAGNEFFSKDKAFKTAFNNFAKKIKTHSNPLHKTLKGGEKVKNIAIMYPGTGGGGHKSPANAMAKNLESQGYKVKLIDSDEYEKPYDPKVDGLTRGEIYSKIYQQAGDFDRARRMWDESGEKQPLQDRKYMRDITNTLRDFKTDHLFVVAHHQPENTALAYQLGVPTTYVHTDNEFHRDLMDVCLNQQELKKPLVSFGALSQKPEFYHYLMEREGKENYNHLPENVRKQMNPLSFPVRENFKQVTAAEKGDIRNSLGIDKEATVVKIAMGANGIPSDIKAIVDRIKTESYLSTKPLHVLIVCGANADLKTELEALQLSDDKVKFEVLGFLDEKQMSDYDKASDVWVTKPGGSTSNEAKKMRKQMLYLVNQHHLWELTNAKGLESENLAEELKIGDSIIAKINKRALIGEQVEHIPQNQSSWTDELANIVHNTAAPILSMA